MNPLTLQRLKDSTDKPIPSPRQQGLAEHCLPITAHLLEFTTHQTSDDINDILNRLRHDGEPPVHLTNTLIQVDPGVVHVKATNHQQHSSNHKSFSDCRQDSIDRINFPT